MDISQISLGLTIRSARRHLLLRYEHLCADPASTFRAMWEHAKLEDSEQTVANFGDTISKPTYYQPPVSEDEINIIREENGSTAARFAY